MSVVGPSHGFMAASQVWPARGTGADRVLVRATPHGLIVALADGAGGRGGGARAAEALIDAVDVVTPGADWLALLDRLDRELAAGPGETTAVVVEVTAAGLRGASVGDSAARLVTAEGAVLDLTAGQQRKPLVGGGAWPVSFGVGPLAAGTLVVASDGLWNHARAAALVDAATLDELDDALAALVALVRLPSGTLPDDVGVILVRVAPRA